MTAAPSSQLGRLASLCILPFGFLGCSLNLTPAPDGGTVTPATVEVLTSPTQMPDPVGPTPTPGPDLAQQLLDSLGESVWHGVATRDGAPRMVEQHFQASSREWAEVVNPWGPSTGRRMRELSVDGNGSTVTATVVNPSGWAADPEEGDEEVVEISIVSGSPRQLRVQWEGGTEVFEEGPAPQAIEGFTAHARVFHPGDAVDEGFCDSGIFGFDYPEIFAFARGIGLSPAATDVAAGIPLGSWIDPGSNTFGVGDVPGFDRDGGTRLTDRYNFFVTYRGVIDHPGGAFSVRETDDRVEDGVWVFAGDDAGAGDEDDYLFEVNGFYWPDGTVAEPSIDLPAGPVPVEIIIARCTEPIEPVSMEFSLGGGPWIPATSVSSQPPLAAVDFPAPF